MDWPLTDLAVFVSLTRPPADLDEELKDACLLLVFVGPRCPPPIPFLPLHTATRSHRVPPPLPIPALSFNFTSALVQLCHKANLCNGPRGPRHLASCVTLYCSYNEDVDWRNLNALAHIIANVQSTFDVKAKAHNSYQETRL
jgi:hypothetical protein